MILGSGKRLFASDGDKQNLRVADSATYPNGITKLVLDVVR